MGWWVLCAITALINGTIKIEMCMFNYVWISFILMYEAFEYWGTKYVKIFVNSYVSLSTKNNQLQYLWKISSLHSNTLFLPYWYYKSSYNALYSEGMAAICQILHAHSMYIVLMYCEYWLESMLRHLSRVRSNQTNANYVVYFFIFFTWRKNWSWTWIWTKGQLKVS